MVWRAPVTESGATFPQPLDDEEAGAALALLTDDEYRWELRAIHAGKVGGTQIFPPRSQEEMLTWAARLNRGYTVYLNLSPVLLDWQEPTAKKAGCASFRWLFLDIDPDKPEAHKDDSATDAEHEAARLVAEQVRDYLGEQDWPAPLVVDSGNGWYLLYAVDLPNTPHSQALLKAVGAHLAGKFTGQGGVVDRCVHNVNRLAKLPGSWARKGASTPERPHRVCRVVHAPGQLRLVPAEMLAQLAGPPEQVRRDEQLPDPFRLRPGQAAQDAYARRALEGEASRVALAVRGPKDGLNNALNKAAFKLGTLGGAGVLARHEAHAALVPLAVSRGLGEQEAEQTFESGWSAGCAQPRVVPGPPAPPPLPGVELASVTVPASEIEPRSVRWLWQWRIPLGKLTTFAGVGGLGKTFVLCDIAARVSRGLEWPDIPGEVRRPGSVLFISGEDDPDDTLVPRLIEQGADRSRVRFLRFEALDRFTLADLKLLDRAAEEIGPELTLVVIDPPSSYLGGVDDHKNSELRQLLTPLRSWVARRLAAMVFNTHLTKPQGKVEAMMRVMGSVAWVNAVRAAHLFARDPDDPEKRFMIPMKSNLGKQAKGLAYQIVALPNDLARVVWHGEVDTTADQAVQSEPRQGRRVAARDWLIERFRERREWPSDELFRAAKEAGVSKNAIFEAKLMLDLPKARKVTAEDGSTCWRWWVPDDWPHLGKG